MLLGGCEMRLENFNDIEKFIEKKFPEDSEELYRRILKRWDESSRKYQNQKGMFYAVYSTVPIDERKNVTTKFVLEGIQEGLDPIEVSKRAFADVVRYVERL